MTVKQLREVIKDLDDGVKVVVGAGDHSYRVAHASVEKAEKALPRRDYYAPEFVEYFDGHSDPERCTTVLLVG